MEKPNFQEQFFIQNLQDQDATLAASLNQIRAVAFTEWEHPLLDWYTDHGFDHSTRIIALIYDIIKPLRALDPYPQSLGLNSGEQFVLLAACYFHDLGMQHLIIDGFNRETLTTRQYRLIRKRHADWGTEIV